MFWIAVSAAGIVGLFIVIGLLSWILKWYRKVEQGHALIINKRKKLIVTFNGGLVIPIIEKGELMDISVKTIEIDRRAKNGLICKDDIRADITVAFYVRVNETADDVIQVAKMVGCHRASDQDVLEQLFNAKFSEALKTVGKRFEFTELYDNREKFNEEIKKTIGMDLNGYRLDDVAIDYLEQTPIENLDKDNILDAEGIRKITEITTEKNIRTNERKRVEEEEIKRRDVEAAEKIFEQERIEKEAEAKKDREIATAQAREDATTKMVQAEELLKAGTAQKKTEEELAIIEQNKLRQIAISEKNKEQAIAVEAERVEKARQLEATERERLVTIEVWKKDKDVEVEKKAIQEVIRERVNLERTVAEEEEKIKDVRFVAEAQRIKDAEIIKANQEAEEAMIIETKAAEAKETAAKHLAQERITLAEADKTRAELESEAEKVRASAKIEMDAAEGMAKVSVEKAEAEAIELRGKAEATALRDMSIAEADAISAKGDAEAHSKQANYKADAEGTEITGSAEATAMTAKFDAEADGILKKADAMKKFDGPGRDHEEFKLKLYKDERIQMAGIDVQERIAEYQAKILGEAVGKAEIDIVGGDGKFLDNFFKSISLAKSVDGFMDKSETAKLLTSGESKIAKQLRDLISEEGIKSEDIKNLTVSALLAKLALEGKSDNSRGRASALQEEVSKMGLQDLMALYLAK